MKASPRQQQLLLELQELDTQHLRLNRRLAQLPERAAFDATSAGQGEIRDRFMEAQRTVEDFRAEIGRIESELETVRQRHERTTDRLASSTQSKEAQALQEELGILENRRNLLEDRELEVMQQAEDAEAALETATAEVTEIEAELNRLRTAIGDGEHAIQQEVEALIDARAGLAAEVQGPVLEVYERTRERYGIGAARLRGRVSEGSNMELDSADYQSAMSTPADELYFCPTSGAILVRDFSADAVS